MFPRFGQDFMLAVGGTVPTNWNMVLVDWHEAFVPASRFAFPNTFQGDRTKAPPGPWEFLACSGPVYDKREPARVEERNPGRLESVSAICRVGHNGIDDHLGLGLTTQVCRTLGMRFRLRKGEMACQNSGA